MKAIFNMKSETIIVSDIKLFSKKKTKSLEKRFRSIHFLSIPSKKTKKQQQQQQQQKTETKIKNYVT